jgi:hypothetical protein
MTDTMQLSVGSIFEHDIPDEGMCIMLVNSMPMLVFNYSLTAGNIDSFQKGEVSFGLFFEQNILFFLFRIDNFLDWSDLAFTIHLSGEKSIEDNGAYLPFNLVLVDSATHIIKALRVVTVSPTFRGLLSKIIHQQGGKHFDTIQYYQDIGNIYETYPSATAMLDYAVIVETGGVRFGEVVR